MVDVSEIKMGEKLNVLLFLMKPIVCIEKILTGNISDFPLQGDNIVKTLEGLAPSAYTGHRFPDSCNFLLPYFVCSSLSHNIMGKYHFKQHLADFNPSVQKDRQM